MTFFDTYCRFIYNQTAISYKRTYFSLKLQRAELMQQVSLLDEALIRQVIETKKNLLFSDDEAGKKQVTQEFVDRVVIQPSRDIDQYDAEITYRVFSNGAKGSRPPVRR